MSDLISRQDAIDTVHYYIESGYKCDIFQELKNLPSAAPERTAKVKNIAHVRGYPPEGECGNCGFDVVDDGEYCPGCGARLEWEADE